MGVGTGVVRMMGTHHFTKQKHDLGEIREESWHDSDCSCGCEVWFEICLSDACGQLYMRTYMTASARK